jgi:cation diffusion facilitator family transporter
VENLSALIETILLLITCVWIIYEAVKRLVTGNLEIEVNVWSYIVIGSSIIIDITRSRALKKAAIKHNSQALEADALHFSTDVWSSSVVLLGLVCAHFGFFYADSVAALMVAVIVISVSYRLGKRSIDVLLDKTPKDVLERINESLKEVPGVLHYHDLRIRTSGADTFVDLNIHVDPTLSIEQAHEISHYVQEMIQSRVQRCTVHVHEEPDNIQ